GGDAAVFLVPALLIEAFGSKALEVGFAGIVSAGFGVDAFDDAFFDGFVNRDAMIAPAHGVAVFGDVADELVEEGVDAALGGDDGELAAPGGAGFGDAIEGALIFVQGELVQGDVAAFAGEGVWVGGEGIDAAAVGELEDVGGGAGFVIEQRFADVA